MLGRAFWTWFEAHVLPGLSEQALPPSAVLRELDERMCALGLSWELGPAPSGEGWAFAVSFNADPERYPAAERLVACAVPMAGCEVLLGKPPKRWDGVLDLPSADGPVRFFTASWLCHVLPMAGGVALVVAPGAAVPPEADADLTRLAAEIAVQGELGEVTTMRRVRDLAIADSEWPGELPGMRCTMHELRVFVALT